MKDEEKSWLHPQSTSKGVCYSTTGGGLSVEFLRYCDMGVEGYTASQTFSLSPNQVVHKFGGFMEGVEMLYLWCNVLDYLTLFVGSELGYELTELVEQYQKVLTAIDEQTAALSTTTAPETLQ